ncbi:MAG: hypothetical protein HYS44_00530 [Candidatus Niyogibacteria bacterium]|nr:hypothetical protein [Candidatus Niyogibacteria bacterium]
MKSLRIQRFVVGAIFLLLVSIPGFVNPTQMNALVTFGNAILALCIAAGLNPLEAVRQRIIKFRKSNA